MQPSLGTFMSSTGATATGVEVSLLWHELSNRVFVDVSDVRAGDSFEVPVTPADNPLDVFEHPYAYAALRGIEYPAGAPREPVYA